MLKSTQRAHDIALPLLSDTHLSHMAPLNMVKLLRDVRHFGRARKENAHLVHKLSDSSLHPHPFPQSV